MQLIKYFQLCKTAVLDLIFPITCLKCQVEGKYLCSSCQNKIHKNEFQICGICGKISVLGKTHADCKKPDGLDGLISAVAYKDPLARKLVEIYKYKFIRDISVSLAEMIFYELQKSNMLEYFHDFILIPMPLHKSRQKWRGFNQAELLADKLSLLTNLKIRTDILSRSIKTKVQAELQDPERVLNVKNAFTSNEFAKGKKIILIDDVSTTRSTLSEACKALKNSAVTEVWGIVFAQG